MKWQLKYLLLASVLTLIGYSRIDAQSVSAFHVEGTSSSYQIADTAKEWSTVHYGFLSWNVAICNGTTRNWFGGDSLFNGKTYLRVYESADSVSTQGGIIGLIREDTLTNSVYYLFDTFGGEGLIYNYSLQIGDSVKIDNYYIGFTDLILHCVNIDTVNILGVNRKRIYLKEWVGSSHYADVWLEGIGSIYGLLTSGFNGAGYAGGGYDLLCCKEDDSLIYFNSSYSTCYIDEFSPQILSEYYDTAYLNTPYEFHIQISDTSGIDSIRWDGYVPEGFVLDEIKGIITGLPTDTGSFNCRALVINRDFGFITDMLYSPIFVSLPTYLHENEYSLTFSVYPNPLTTSTTIEYEIYTRANIQYTVYNSVGETVFDEKERNVSPGKHSIPLSLLHLPSGMYYAVLRSEKGVRVVKMVKE